MDFKTEDIFPQYFPFWDKLTIEQKNSIIQNVQYTTYEKGTHIHNGENDCIGVLLILSGELRTYILSEEGKEITLFRLFDKDICVLSASCILSNITFDVFIETQKKTEILLINSNIFNKIVEKNIYAEAFLYKLTTMRFSDVMWAMQQILFMSMDKRLAIFLSDESSKLNSDTIKLTHEEIAKYIGSAREVVSRMLKYFQSERILELSRGGIKIVDKKRLKEIATL